MKPLEAPHQAHDGNLATARRDGQTNGVVDEDERDEGEAPRAPRRRCGCSPSPQEDGDLLLAQRTPALTSASTSSTLGVVIVDDLTKSGSSLMRLAVSSTCEESSIWMTKEARQRVLAVERRDGGLRMVGHGRTVIGERVLLGLELDAGDVCPRSRARRGTPGHPHRTHRPR